MRDLVRRFINWMEAAPAYQTVWFIPLMLVLWLFAKAINYQKDNA